MAMLNNQRVTMKIMINLKAQGFFFNACESRIRFLGGASKIIQVFVVRNSLTLW